MVVERASTGSSVIEVLDRVLDKGIVIDAWVRVSVVGIDLVAVHAHVVVASIETYLKYSNPAFDDFERSAAESGAWRRPVQPRAAA